MSTVCGSSLLTSTVSSERDVWLLMVSMVSEYSIGVMLLVSVSMLTSKA